MVADRSRGGSGKLGWRERVVGRASGTIGGTSSPAGSALVDTDTGRLLVKRSQPGRSPIHGWGLFVREAIADGELIDESPLLVVPHCPAGMTSHVWELSNGRCAVELGDGVLCNSADDPNARFEIDERRQIVSLIAVRGIGVGDEITIAYAVEG